jgi:hypothetical protein
MAEYVQRTREYDPFGKMTRATVLRLALKEGLRVLKERREAEEGAWLIEATGGSKK